MPVEKSLPAYRQVVRLLQEAIANGEYPAGTLLPAEPVLAAKFNVSRSTINNAMAYLRYWGLVRVKRGVGTMVRPIPALHRYAANRYLEAVRADGGARGAFDAELRKAGLEPRSDLEVSVVPATVDVAAALGLEEGDPVVCRMRHMYARQPEGEWVPVQVCPSYIPADIAEGTALAERDSGPGGIISRFAELGWPQVRLDESVRARPATPAEEEFLELDEAEQVVEIWHLGIAERDGEERPVELAVHVLPAGQWVLHYSIPIRPAAQ